jgi:hypothetical protein
MRCSWPRNSSRERGRMRSARGAATWVGFSPGAGAKRLMVSGFFGSEEWIHDTQISEGLTVLEVLRIEEVAA